MMKSLIFLSLLCFTSTAFTSEFNCTITANEESQKVTISTGVGGMVRFNNGFDALYILDYDKFEKNSIVGTIQFENRLEGHAPVLVISGGNPKRFAVQAQFPGVGQPRSYKFFEASCKLAN